jgi:hypothetical protein
MDPFWASEEDAHISVTKSQRKDVVECRIVPLLLVLNGYMFTINKFGKAIMNGPLVSSFEIGFGIYNMWFLQHWMEWSIGFCPRGFDAYVRVPVSKVWNGDYSASPESVLLPERVTPNKEKFHRDHRRAGSRSSTNRTVRRWYTVERANFGTFSSDNKVKTDEPWSIRPVHRLPMSVGEFSFTDLPDWAGYWKVPLTTDQVNPLYRNWKLALDQQGFSYHFNPWKPELYFSNSLASAEGLPPNAKLLGLPKLELLLGVDGNCMAGSEPLSSSSLQKGDAFLF